MTQGSPVSADEKARFISVLRDTGSYTYAAAAIGRSRSTMKRHEITDDHFAADVAEANEDAADALELEARRRAMEGEVTKTVKDRHGNVIVEERKKSDPILMFLLKGRKREVFGDRAALDMTSSDGSMSPAMGDTEASARIASFLALAEARQKAQESDDGSQVDDGSDLL